MRKITTGWIHRPAKMLHRLRPGKQFLSGDSASPGANPPKRRGIRILSRQILLRHFFLDVETVEFRHLLPDGGWSPAIPRVNIDRGDSAAAFVFEPQTNLLHFAKQFRYSTYDYTDEYRQENGWLVEIPAGRLRKGEQPRECIIREIDEELGATVITLEPISDFYLTPGASSERLFLFYAEVQISDVQYTLTGGRNAEEYIQKLAMPPKDFFHGLDENTWQDAKTIIGGEWFRRRCVSGDIANRRNGHGEQ